MGDAGSNGSRRGAPRFSIPRVLLAPVLAGTCVFAAETVAQRGPGPATPATLAAIPPTPIRGLRESFDPVSVRGRVAEIFGADFILDDGTGRALIETRSRDAVALPVAAGATVTVQGRFLRGVVRATVLADAAGRVTGFGPSQDGRHGGWGDHGGRGPAPCGPGMSPPAGGGG